LTVFKCTLNHRIRIIPRFGEVAQRDLTRTVEARLFYRWNDLPIAQQSATNSQLFKQCDHMMAEIAIYLL